MDRAKSEQPPEKYGRAHAPERRAVFWDLGVLDYQAALSLQELTRERLLENPEEPGRVFFVQHPLVFTLGRRGGRENLVVPERFISSQNISIVPTGRGGNITCHCPGQAVLYPVIHLKRLKIPVREFVFGLEEVMRLTAAAFGVETRRDCRNRGLWAGQGKIGSVGIAIRKGVSIHGLALNVRCDLRPFSWINPCGLEHQSMTSVVREGSMRNNGQDLSMDKVREEMFACFCEVFSFIRCDRPYVRNQHLPI